MRKAVRQGLSTSESPDEMLTGGVIGVDAGRRSAVFFFFGDAEEGEREKMPGVFSHAGSPSRKCPLLAFGDDPLAHSLARSLGCSTNLARV